MMYHKLSWGREGSAISIFGWNICFNSQLRNQDARHFEEKKSFMQYIGKSVLNAVSSHEDQSDHNMQKNLTQHGFFCARQQRMGYHAAILYSCQCCQTFSIETVDLWNGKSSELTLAEQKVFLPHLWVIGM